MKAVMVMFDSLNRHMLPNYGCDWVIAPNFERLGQKSITFDNCYIGSMPCMPARRELHTGRLNFLHRSWGPLEPFDDSMPEILKSNNIHSHLVTDHYHYWEDGGATYHNRYSTYEMVRGQEGDLWKGEVEKPEVPDLAIELNKLFTPIFQQDTINKKYIITEEDSTQARTFKLGCEFIEKNHESDNWFLQIEAFDPHEPFTVPNKYKELYSDFPDGKDVYWPQYSYVKETEEVVKHGKYEYAALLSMCDSYLGKVLDMFDKYNLWEDTMLIVNTDHGYLLGEHGWWAKTVMPNYNEIANTPLFVYDPRQDVEGQRRQALVQTIDIAPTILDFFGIDIPKDMQGKALKETIESDKKIRDAALFGYHEGHINITDGRYVYMRAPMRIDNQPLYNYTLMPCHMRGRFKVEEMQDIELQAPFSFTKGCRIMKTKAPMSITHPFSFGTKLFDLKESPRQEAELSDNDVELYLCNKMIELMKENDAPQTQFERVGYPQHDMSMEDLIKLNSVCKQNEDITDFDEYKYADNAKMQFKTLLKFIPEENIPQIKGGLKQYMSAMKSKTITGDGLIAFINIALPEQSRPMVSYFVSLAGRRS